MKYLKQFLIIITITFIAELIKFVINLPIPTSVWGMMIMLLCLCFKVIKLEDVEKTSEFLISIMPIMFVPGAVEIIIHYTKISPFIIAFLTIICISTLVVMVSVSKTCDFLLERKHSKDV